MSNRSVYRCKHTLVACMQSDRRREGEVDESSAEAADPMKTSSYPSQSMSENERA